jgi:hypothetical protein
MYLCVCSVCADCGDRTEARQWLSISPLCGNISWWSTLEVEMLWSSEIMQFVRWIILSSTAVCIWKEKLCACSDQQFAWVMSFLLPRVNVCVLVPELLKMNT